MSKRKELSVHKGEEIIRLRQSGKSFRAIASFDRFNETGNNFNRPGRGR